MKELNWVEARSNYIAELELGRAVISPNVSDNSNWRPYTARVELKSGKVVAEISLDFESCQSWAAVQLPLLDQVTGRFSECGNVLETLEKCQNLLSREIDKTHWLRIEYIKKWMFDRLGQIYEIVTLPSVEHKPYALDWVENGSIFYAETPHGRAEIEEKRAKNIIAGGIRHYARIIHHTGTVLDCHDFVDFMEAENELKRRLTELAEPDIYEIYLPQIEFTLNICQRVLPDDTDPIHYARLENLGGVIFLALD